MRRGGLSTICGAHLLTPHDELLLLSIPFQNRSLISTNRDIPRSSSGSQQQPRTRSALAPAPLCARANPPVRSAGLAEADAALHGLADPSDTLPDPDLTIPARSRTFPVSIPGNSQPERTQFCGFDGVGGSSVRACFEDLPCKLPLNRESRRRAPFGQSPFCCTQKPRPGRPWRETVLAAEAAEKWP